MSQNGQGALADKNERAKVLMRREKMVNFRAGQGNDASKALHHNRR